MYWSHTHNTHHNNTVLSNNKSLIFHAVTIMSILILAIFRIECSFRSLSLFSFYDYDKIYCMQSSIKMSCFIIWIFKISAASHYTHRSSNPSLQEFLDSKFNPFNPWLIVTKYSKVYWMFIIILNFEGTLRSRDFENMIYILQFKSSSFSK